VEKIVYAVVSVKESPRDFNEMVRGIEGIAGSALYLLTLNDIAIAVSNFTTSKYNLNKELALEYAKVIEKLYQQVVLLPIRFGTFLKSDEMIGQLMADHYDSMVDNLNRVANKEEYGLKILWDYEKSKLKIKDSLDSKGINGKDYFSKETVYNNYLLEKIKKHRLEDAILKHVEQLIDEITQHLRQISPEFKCKKMMTNTIILDLDFLVQKTKGDEFIQKIEALRLSKEDLHFLLTGPWPPYSFVEITID